MWSVVYTLPDPLRTLLVEGATHPWYVHPEIIKIKRGVDYHTTAKIKETKKQTRALGPQKPSPEGPRSLLGGTMKARTIHYIAKTVGRGLRSLAQAIGFETPGSTGRQYLRRDDVRKALRKTNGCTPRLRREWAGGVRNNKTIPKYRCVCTCVRLYVCTCVLCTIITEGSTTKFPKA